MMKKMNMMKKKSWTISLLLLIFLSVTFSMMIPYLTGLVTEKHFLKFYQSTEPNQTVKTLEHIYQRGWFGSFAQAVVETPKTLPVENHHRFLLTHQIKHGWVPIRSIFIHTTLHPLRQLDQSTVSSQLATSNTSFAQQKPLFDIQTQVQSNGDSISELAGLSLTLSLETVEIQGKQLQGSLSVENQASLLAANLDGLNWQITYPAYHFIIPQWALNGTLQIEKTQPLQGQGDFSLAQLQLSSFQSTKITLAKVKGGGIDYQLSDHLTFTTTTQIAQLQIENDLIGPMSSEIVVQHWHLPSLSKLINRLAQIPPTQLSSPQSKMTLLQLVPQGIIFLQNTPALQINALNLQTPEGKVTGNLQFQVQSFKFSPFMLFKPILFLQYLQGQLDLAVPQALLEPTQSSIPASAARRWLQERLKAWQNHKILIPAPNQPGYYTTAMQLNNGILQVNGQQRPIDILLPK